jgi:hypothetical protein
MKRICMYCGTTAHFSKDDGVTSTGSIHIWSCHCGKTHSGCQLCWEKLRKFVGEFPNQRLALRQCPERGKFKAPDHGSQAPQS